MTTVVELAKTASRAFQALWSTIFVRRWVGDSLAVQGSEFPSMLIADSIDNQGLLGKYKKSILLCCVGGATNARDSLPYLLVRLVARLETLPDERGCLGIG
jgi:hypothetical protein